MPAKRNIPTESKTTETPASDTPAEDKTGGAEASGTMHVRAGNPAHADQKGRSDMSDLAPVAKTPPTRGGGDSIAPEVVEAYATALQGAAIGTALGPDAAATTAGTARSTAYKLRVALHERGTFTKTRSWRADPATKGDDVPHFWAVVLINEADYKVKSD